MSMNPIIKIENLNLWYEKDKPNEVHALKNINLEIERGDYVAFFGPSGCGKTSMLYSISGIDRFQSGQVLINGRNISGLTNQELSIFRQTGIGIVFQQFNLVPSLTVIKNVILPMLFVGVHSKRAEDEALKLLERLNLSQFADRYPYELSGGQQQRVGIARALANNPPIIIADEPLGNLDSVNAKIVLDFLRELNEKDGRTVIMVTHEAWSLKDAKTIFHMKDGNMIEIEKIDGGNVVDSVSKRLQDQISDVSDDKEKFKFVNEKISTRILANFLLKGYSIDEITRFEKFVEDRFNQKIDRDGLKEILNKPFKDGGLGLWKKKSLKVADYLEGVVKMKENIACIYKSMAENPNSSISRRVIDIRNWLLEGYAGKLKEIQVKALDQVIEDRLRNLIPVDKVVEVLDLSNSQFGVGLSFRAASVIAEKLDLILRKDAGDLECSLDSEYNK